MQRGRQRSPSRGSSRGGSQSPIYKKSRPVVLLANLTRNSSKDHVLEIMKFFGHVVDVEFEPLDLSEKVAPGRRNCIVEYRTNMDAETAVEKMDRGVIDGVTVRVESLNRIQLADKHTEWKLAQEKRPASSQRATSPYQSSQSRLDQRRRSRSPSRSDQREKRSRSRDRSRRSRSRERRSMRRSDRSRY